MLAAIRRGPFAQPTEEEHIEYLLQRKRRDQERPAFENYSLEHVLAFQRRVGALKNNFMQRGACTPLGTIRDWWDRTEAQMRAALHAHILVWMKQRQQPKEYEFLEPVPREAPGTEPRQRPRDRPLARGDHAGGGRGPRPFGGAAGSAAASGRRAARTVRDKMG